MNMIIIYSSPLLFYIFLTPDFCLLTPDYFKHFPI